MAIPGEVTFIDPQADAEGLHRVWVEVKNLKNDGQWLLAEGQAVKLTIQARDERGPLSRVVSIRVGQREAKDVLAEMCVH